MKHEELLNRLYENSAIYEYEKPVVSQIEAAGTGDNLNVTVCAVAQKIAQEIGQLPYQESYNILKSFKIAGEKAGISYFWDFASKTDRKAFLRVVKNEESGEHLTYEEFQQRNEDDNTNEVLQSYVAFFLEKIEADNVPQGQKTGPRY